MIMDKEMAFQDFVAKYVIERLPNELLNIDKRYRENKESIEKGLINAFEEVCKRALSLQQQGIKEDIGYISFSFLRTSIINNTSFYRVDAYGKEWFMDEVECCASWDAGFIFQSLFSHMKEIEGKKAEYARLITSMDIDRIKFIESGRYHVLTVELIREMLPRLIDCESYKAMKKTSEIRITAGEYMDKIEVLFENNK